MNKETIVDIVFSIYDFNGDYTRHTGTTLMSILYNTKADIRVNILHDQTLTEINRQNLCEICTDFHTKIRFYNIKISEGIRSCNAIKAFSIGTLFRLYIAELINDIPKIIYMDSDVICNMDIQKLWDEDIKSFALGAVIDSGVYEKNNKSFELEFYRKRGILKNIYFNAGILILNLDKIRKQYDLLQQGMDFLLKYPEAPYLDQDALNYIFQNDCIFLTDKYNKSVRYAFADGTSKYNNEAEWQNICWHFYTAAKPWIISKYPVSDLYWRYFYKTPWGKDINNFIKYYKKVVPFLDDGLQYQPIGRRRYFIMAFIKRLRAEFKKKYDL